MTNHPDKKGGNKEKFMEIKKAYEILSQSDSLSEEKVAEDAYQSSSRHDFHKATTKESSKFKSQMIGFTLAVTLLFIINHQFQSQSKRTMRMQQQIGSQIASKRIQ